MENAKDLFQSYWMKEPIGRIKKLRVIGQPALIHLIVELRLRIQRLINQLTMSSSREIVWTRAPGNGRLMATEKQWSKRK